MAAQVVDEMKLGTSFDQASDFPTEVEALELERAADVVVATDGLAEDDVGALLLEATRSDD